MSYDTTRHGVKDFHRKFSNAVAGYFRNKARGRPGRKFVSTAYGQSADYNTYTIKSLDADEEVINFDYITFNEAADFVRKWWPEGQIKGIDGGPVTSDTPRVNKKKYREESGYYKRKAEHKGRHYEDLELCEYHEPQMIHGVWGYIRKDELPDLHRPHGARQSWAPWNREGRYAEALVHNKILERLQKGLARWKRMTREFPLASCGNPLEVTTCRTGYRKARAYLVCPSCAKKRIGIK